jgi:Esterase-like activity of phytase
MHIARTCLALSVTSALLTACGSDDSPTVDGTFVDAAVENLDVRVGGGAATQTSALGAFTCREGETVDFSLGGLALGSATCTTLVTPITLVAGSNAKSDAVVNRAFALQSFDEDGDPSNGIKLSAALKTALAGKTLDFGAAPAAFNSALTTLLTGLPEPYKSRPVSDDRRMLAREHFENSLVAAGVAPFGDAVSQTNALGTVTATINRYRIQADKSFYVPYPGSAAAVKADFAEGFLPAYGSGLALKGKLADGTLEFYAITDRGPNGDGPKVPNTGSSLCFVRADATCDAKLFPAPAFAPSIGVISVGANGAVLKSSMTIKVNAATPINGLPYAAGQLGSSGELPLTDALKFEPTTAANFSTIGLDTESVVVDAARNALWISDEYGPFIVKVDPANGVILKKYGPAIPAGSTVTAANGITTVLPAVLAKRRANRGMEGLALEISSGRLHGFLQSPLTDLTAAGAPATATYVAPQGSGCIDAGTGKRVERYARFARWLEFNPDTETSKMYAYPISCADYLDNRTGNAKLGDMVSLGSGKFIVIEQGAGPTGKVFNRLMLVEIGSATDISQAAFNPTTSDLEKSSMGAVAVSGADYATVVPMKKTLLLDLNAAGWLAEKAEGLALVDATTLALTNDDDFGLRMRVDDAAGAEIAGADITACISTAGVLSACGTGVAARVTRGSDVERPNRLWLIKFGRNLAEYSVPTP